MTPHIQTLTPNGCICGKEECLIPYGLCHCGCGGKTEIRPFRYTPAGCIRDFPSIYIKFHNRRSYRVDLSGSAPFKIDGVYCRLIPLTKGQYTIVWESDYEWLSQWVWNAMKSNSTGTHYAVRAEKINGKWISILMHRQILGIYSSSHPDQIGDHEDSINTLDNRRSNLRIADPSESSANTRTPSNNTSGFKGASFDKEKGRWEGNIRWEGKQYFLGYFNSREAAHLAYCKRAEELHGEFARYK